MAGNPYWDKLVLGLHCDGTNGSTTFPEVKGNTVTANGNAQISTAQYPALTGKTSSALFDGNGDFLTVPDSNAFDLGSGAFTLRARIYLTGYAANNGGQYKSCIIGQDIPTSRAFSLAVDGTASSYTSLIFTGFADNVPNYTAVTVSYSFSLNTWYDVEVNRSGNLVYIFIDGTLQNAGGTAFSRTIQNSTTTLKIGALDYNATYYYYFPGHISEVEVYKGVALHTAGFTPSGDPFESGYLPSGSGVVSAVGNVPYFSYGATSRPVIFVNA